MTNEGWYACLTCEQEFPASDLLLCLEPHRNGEAKLQCLPCDTKHREREHGGAAREWVH